MKPSAIFALAATPLEAPAVGQTFDRPFRLAPPFAPAGTSDVPDRILAPELTRPLGQSAAVDNRSGTAGNLGARLAAQSNPDGRAILLIDNVKRG